MEWLGRMVVLVGGCALGCAPRLVDSDDDQGEGSTQDTAPAPDDDAADDPDPMPPPPDPTVDEGPVDEGPVDEGTTIEEDDEGGTTGMPTTAGDDAGEPGGVGDDPVDDEPGDVDLPSADVVATAVYTDGTLVDFRVQLVAPPFAQEATFSIDWCIDGSAIGNGSCGTHADGIDAYLTLFQVDGGAVGEFDSSTPGVDPCLHAAFEAETNTLRVLVPVELVDDDGDFDWVLTVTFGGSGGANEWCPNEGTAPVIVVDELPPFSGTPSCF